MDNPKSFQWEMQKEAGRFELELKPFSSFPLVSKNGSLVFRNQLVDAQPTGGETELISFEKRAELFLKKLSKLIYNHFDADASYISAMSGKTVTERWTPTTSAQDLAVCFLDNMHHAMKRGDNSYVSFIVQAPADIHEDLTAIPAHKSPVTALEAALTKAQDAAHRAGIPFMFTTQVDIQGKNDPRDILLAMHFSENKDHIAPVKVKIKHAIKNLVVAFDDLFEQGMTMRVSMGIDVDEVDSSLELQHALQQHLESRLYDGTLTPIIAHVKMP